MPSLKQLQIKKADRQKIVALTAYDWQTANWLSGCGLDFILVGDSVANVIAGHGTTLPMTMDEMIYHTRMVVRGAGTIPVIADMPFLSYEIDDCEAVRNAGRFVKEAGATGVKIEGGMQVVSAVRKMVAAHIPVLGHVGLTPQSVLQLGGYTVQGRSNESAEQIKCDAQALQDAGVFGIVLECIPRKLAKELSASLSVPTIGIGAGPDCDGQILVTHDLLGWDESPKKFVKPYAAFRSDAEKAVKSFVSDVQSGAFPDDAHSF